MQLEFSIHALGLKNVAGAFKGTSDPFAVVTQIATKAGSKPAVLGKTEVIKNTLSPQWTKVFVFDYELGIPMKVAVSIFDEVRKGDNKGMGSAVFDVGELLGARGNTKAKRLAKGGTIFAHVRKSVGSGLLRLHLKGQKLKNVEGLFGKSDPFFEILRKIDSAGGQTWDNVFRSKPVKNNLNPDWETAVIQLSTLCGGDQDLPLKICLYDFESSGKHVSMGEFETTVKGMVAASGGAKTFEVVRKNKACGTVTVERAEVSGVQGDIVAKTAAMNISSPAPVIGTPSFVDYVSGGCELNVCVAIDFTGSNGDPRKPGTLHYMDPSGAYNDYEKAISAIVRILAKYDSDQSFPVLGFGAKYDGQVRHCFQVGPTEEAHGVDGVIQAYRTVFKSGLTLSAPTVFTEVIQTAAARAASAQQAAHAKGGQAYTILLILTDGAVSNVQTTAQCLDAVSTTPLSVVIVGVGSANFSSMQFLDDANKPPHRDIAQFVEFNKHKSDSQALSSATLHEIPDQLVEYFQKNGIQPLSAVQVDEAEIIVEAEEEEIDLSLDISEGEIVVNGGGTSFYDAFKPM